MNVRAGTEAVSQPREPGVLDRQLDEFEQVIGELFAQTAATRAVVDRLTNPEAPEVKHAQDLAKVKQLGHTIESRLRDIHESLLVLRDEMIYNRGRLDRAC
jgi:hypothetical protein